MNTKNQKSLFPESLPDHCPDLTYEELKECDDVLDEYLELCIEIYWQKVADGSYPWPVDADNPDSTLID